MGSRVRAIPFGRVYGDPPAAGLVSEVRAGRGYQPKSPLQRSSFPATERAFRVDGFAARTSLCAGILHCDDRPMPATGRYSIARAYNCAKRRPLYSESSPDFDSDECSVLVPVYRALVIRNRRKFHDLEVRQHAKARANHNSDQLPEKFGRSVL